MAGVTFPAIVIADSFESLIAAELEMFIDDVAPEVVQVVPSEKFVCM